MKPHVVIAGPLVAVMYFPQVRTQFGKLEKPNEVFVAGENIMTGKTMARRIDWFSAGTLAPEHMVALARRMRAVIRRKTGEVRAEHEYD